jgi:hypothetical protein
MSWLKSSPPSERETAEKNLAKSGVPESRPQPGYEGRFANYVVKDGNGRGRDRHSVGYVIPSGGKSYLQEMDEEEDRMLREGEL